MALKYQVSQQLKDKNLVYGNYPAKTDIEAIHKACIAHAPFREIDYTIPFHVKKGKYQNDVIMEAPIE